MGNPRISISFIIVGPKIGSFRSFTIIIFRKLASIRRIDNFVDFIIIIIIINYFDWIVTTDDIIDLYFDTWYVQRLTRCISIEAIRL